MKRFTSRMLAIMLAGALAAGNLSVSAFGSDGIMDSVEIADTAEIAAEEAAAEGSEAKTEDVDHAGEVTSCTVTLNANGGYFINEWDDVLNETLEKTEILNKIIPIGETVSAYPVPVREIASAVFRGWSMDRGGEMMTSQEQGEFAPVEDCVLYAVWEYEDTDSQEIPRDHSGFDNEIGESAAYESTFAPAAEDREQGDMVQGDAAQDDMMQEDAAQEDLPEEGLPEEDAAQDDLTQGQTVQEDLPEEDLPEEDSAQDDLMQGQTVQEELPEEGLPEEDLQEEEASDAARTEVPAAVSEAGESGTEGVREEKKSADSTSKVPGSTWLNDITPDQTSGYYYDTDEIINNIGSTLYSKAVEFDASYDTFAVYKLNKSYKTFTGTVCTGKSTGAGVFTLSFYGDGELIHEISGVTNDNNYKSFDLDVSGVTDLKIQSDNSGSWADGWVYIADGLLRENESGEVIKIYTADDLKGISNNLSGSYLLMEDINLAHIDWEPIGSSTAPFVGKFNGNGHVISNLWIQDMGDYRGLFGMTDGALITRVTVSGNISGRTFAGGISGYSRNTEITYCINKTMVSGADQIGGIVGRLEGGSVDYCMNTCSITASSRGCGGIAADIYPSGTITNCLNLGNVWGGTDLTGGIAGGSTECTISSCVNAANVSCQSGRVGAIAGDNASYAGSRVNNYFIQNNDIPNNYSVEGSDCGTFSSIDDDLVKDLKKKILSGNGIDENSLEDLLTPSECTIAMDDSYTTTVGEEIEISAEIQSEVFTPAVSNMSWIVKPAGENNVDIGDMVIIESSTNTYTLSSVFKFTKDGNYTVVLKTDRGDEASTVVRVNLEKLLKITPPSTKPGFVYAGDLNAEKTFTATLEDEDARPKKSDFLFNLKKSDSLTSVPSRELADSDVQVKEIKQLSDRKYEITFAYKPDETGFYGLTISYKDNVDDTELMVYDSNILEKLEKDPDKTLNTYYKQYGKKIKAELGRLAKESDEKTDYMLKAQELKNTSSLNLLTDAIADENVDLDSLNLCAYETLARYYDKYGKVKSIHFDEVDNDTAASMITQNVAKYIAQGYGNNLKNVKLDSMAEIGGKSYHVKATTNILLGFQQITLTIQDQSRDGRLFLFYCYDKKAIETQAADYIKALRELFKSSMNNAAQSWYKDFSELLGWDIKKDIEDGIEDYRNELSKDIVDCMERHGIKNLLDNLKTCQNYYKQIKGAREKLQNAVTVMKRGNTSLYDKAVSLNEIRNIKINTLESGDCAEDVYNLLKEAQEKGRDYMVEYFTTGTIKDLETENLGNNIGSFFKNIFKCPVSVTVLDPSGQAVGYVGDDDIWFNDPVYIEENGDEKIIYTPGAAGYHFNVTGTDYGLVSYTVQELVNGEPSGDYLNYFDIPVEKGSDIQVEIQKDSVHSAEDVSVIAGETACQPEIADQSSAINVRINNDSGKGTVTGAGSYHLGDMASLCACPSEGYYFAGWYEGSVLRTSLEEYQFEVRQDIVLTPAWLYMSQESGESEALPVLSKPVKTGSCGSNCFWTYCDNGDLIISGSGDLSGWTSFHTPWEEYKSSIKRVSIEDGISYIGNSAFYKCTALEEVVFPDSITGIGELVFYSCKKLTTLKIPEKVEMVSFHLASGCDNLREVILPAGVKVIMGRAFENCYNLQSVTIPGDSLSTIYDLAFLGCTSLKDIYYDHSNADWYSLNLGINDKNRLLENGTEIHCSEYTDITGNCGDDISWSLDRNGVLKISGTGTMENFGSSTGPWEYQPIKEILIGEGITNIGTWAFRGCLVLETVSFPESLTNIAFSSFEDCISLKSIELPEGTKSLGDYSFRGCKNLQRIEIPSSVTEIAPTVFKSSAEYKGPENLTIYGPRASCAETFAADNNIRFVRRERLTGSSITVSPLEDQTYTGKAIEPLPEIKCADETLTADTDYKVSYANNVDAGTASIIITGMGYFTGTINRPFKIIPATVSKAAVSGLSAKTYTGKAITQTPIVKIGSTTLTRNTDYTVSFKNNTNAGTATVTIKGKGNYTGTKTATFKINKTTQSITAKSTASSIAVGRKATVSITGNKGSKSYKSSNDGIATVNSKGLVTAKKVGTVTITASAAATSNYNAASKKLTIKVVPAATSSITAANLATGIRLTWKKVAGATGYRVYRGSSLIKTIKSGSTVACTDTKANTNGTKYTFKIVPTASTGNGTAKSLTTCRVARPTVSSVQNSASRKMTVKWGKNAKATGYQIQYSTSRTFSSENKTLTVTKAGTVSKVIGSLTKGKTYYVRIRTCKAVGETKYWSAWSAAKSVKISR